MIKFMLVLLSLQAHADDWFCKTQAAAKQGPATIMACGVGSSEDPSEARDTARENAITEFRRLCSISSDCRDFDYNVEPKRLDCELHQNKTTCYQAIQFEILNTKRKEIYLDLKEIEKQLDSKKRELQSQEDRVNKLKELKAKSELSEKNEAKLQILEKNIDKVQGEELKLEEQSEPDQSGYVYMHQLFKNSLKVSTKYWNSNFFKSGEMNTLLDLSYEYRPNTRLGLGASYGFGTDLGSTSKSDSDIPRTGPANTAGTSDGSMQIKDLSVSAIIYMGNGFYSKTELGVASATKKQYQISYGPLGTALQTREVDLSTSKNYIGGEFGYDSRHKQKGLGFFGEVGARHSGTFDIVGSVGFNFGF